MIVKVRVLHGALLSDNRTTFGPGDELEMPLAEANRRKGKVELVGVEPPSLNVVQGKLPAAEAVAAAKAATTQEALAELKRNEDRKTVLAAIEQREDELAAL